MLIKIEVYRVGMIWSLLFWRCCIFITEKFWIIFSKITSIIWCEEKYGEWCCRVLESVFILLPDYPLIEIEKNILCTFVDSLCKRQTAAQTNSICYFCWRIPIYFVEDYYLWNLACAHCLFILNISKWKSCLGWPLLFPDRKAPEVGPLLRISQWYYLPTYPDQTICLRHKMADSMSRLQVHLQRPVLCPDKILCPRLTDRDPLS